MRATWGTAATWASEPDVLVDLDELMLIQPDPNAKASALDLFAQRWGAYRDRTGLRS